MRRPFLTIAAIVVVTTFASNANADTWRGAAAISAAAQNFTPILKAACGPHWGRCGPYHHLVCGPRGRCACVHC